MKSSRLLILGSAMATAMEAAFAGTEERFRIEDKARRNEPLLVMLNNLPPAKNPDRSQEKSALYLRKAEEKRRRKQLKRRK